MFAKAPSPRIRIFAPIALLALAACAPDDTVPMDEGETTQTAAEPSAAAIDPADIAPGQTQTPIPAEFRALGTEPFWAVVSTGSGLRYSTPENSDGTPVEIIEAIADGEKREITGSLADKTFTIVLTVEPCSDGMSDRAYPFKASLLLDGETLEGCARPVD